MRGGWGALGAISLSVVFAAAVGATLTYSSEKSGSV